MFVATSLLVVVSAAVAAPDFFGSANSLPESGPEIGKRVPYVIHANLVSGRKISISSALE